MFRGLSLSIEGMKKFSTFLTANLTQSFQVQSGFWCNRKTLGDLQLRKQTGARVIAVVRNNEVHPNPDLQFSLTPDDILILFGRHAQLDQSVKVLELGGKPERREPGPGGQGE